MLANYGKSKKLFQKYKPAITATLKCFKEMKKLGLI